MEIDKLLDGIEAFLDALEENEEIGDANACSSSSVNYGESYAAEEKRNRQYLRQTCLEVALKNSQHGLVNQAPTANQLISAARQLEAYVMGEDDGE